ncbi:transporter substrate-binding domain-containing protein [Aquabacterium sp.]|uniref:transporter substrate-binding domain-containing protein n=1 Tax=Aquabacterium sp. TaxID=1872578 RepID=UPI0040380A96
MIRKRLCWQASCLIMLIHLSSGSLAQTVQDSPLLQKIASTGVIKLGHREASIPFSYYDNNQAVVGYSQDLANAVVKRVSVVTGRKDLKPVFVPINSQNRIPLLLNGVIDLECGSTTHNRDREKQAAFSTSIFVTNTKTMVKKSMPFNDLMDLRGKNVVVTAGTSAERMLKRFNQDKALGMRILTAKDHSESFLMLETDRAVGFVMDDALLYGERAKSSQPGNWKVIGPVLAKEAYGCMLRPGDPVFKKLVDEVVTKALSGQEGRKLYDKWFLSPIPPRHINLDWPPSSDVLSLFAHPNDQALD